MRNDRPEPPSPGTLYVAALYLATRYAENPNPAVGGMVMQQLECIARHPDPSVPEELRDACRRLHAHWRLMGTGNKPAATATSTIAGTDRLH